MNKRRLKFIMLFAAVFAISVSVAFIPGIGKTEADAVQPLKAEYSLGDPFRFEKTSVVIEGETVEVTAKRLLFPDRTLFEGNETVLSAAGQYVIEYDAVKDGRLHTVRESFVVPDRLYYADSFSSTVKYGKNPYDGGREGLNVNLVSDSVFYFNPVIDLNGKTKDDILISFLVTPNVMGSDDMKYVFVRLTDLYDPDNYVVFRVRRSPDGGLLSRRGSYSVGGAHYHETGSFAGASHGHPEDDPEVLPETETGGYGFAMDYSFSGYTYEYGGTKPVTFAIDYEKKTLHCTPNCYSGGGDYLCSLERDLKKPWPGFTTGEVRLSVYFDGYISGSGGISIENIYDYDLSVNVNKDEAPSYPDIDYDGYEPDKIPDALTGYKYPLFKASAFEKYGLEKLYTAVYYNYNASGRYLCECGDGYFVPDREGKYTIEYSLKDRFGRIGKKLVEVNAVSEPRPITFDIGETEEGPHPIASLVPVAPYENVSGGYGRVNVKVSIEKRDGTVVAEEAGDSYKFYESGEYDVVYTAEDYVGQTMVKKYPLTIQNGTKPVFEEEIKLPKYFIKGYKYKLNKVFANDYTSGKRETVEAKVTAIGGTVSEGFFKATGSRAVLIYKATAATGESAEVKKEVPIIDVKEGEKIDLRKYFVLNDVSAVSSHDNIAFTITGKKGRLQFINPVPADNFVIKFYAKRTHNAMTALTFRLTDFEDDAKSVEIRLVPDKEGGSLAYTQGAEPYRLPAVDINLNTVENELKFDGNIRFGNETVYLCEYLSGEPFAGFKSGKVYLEVEIEGSPGNTGLSVSNICGQPMNDNDEDEIAPVIIFSDAIGGRYDKDCELKIPHVICCDILNPETEATVTVKTKAGIVTALDGTKLENADCLKDITLKLTESATYVCRFVYSDSAGNEDAFTYLIKVRDDTPPVISVDESQLVAKAGKSCKIAEATATDDVTLSDDIKITVFLIGSDGYMRKVNNGGSFKAEKGGYSLVYVAVDKAGNFGRKVVSVTVE